MSDETKIVIGETPTSTWNYHLRQVDERDVKLGGKENLVALCGRKLGWDTKIPLRAWGRKDHIPSHWCETCEKKARELGYTI